MDHLRDLHGGDRHPDRRLIGAGESVATALSDTLGFAEMSRVLGIVNLAVIPLILFVTRRFAALWSRRRIDLVVSGG